VNDLDDFLFSLVLLIVDFGAVVGGIACVAFGPLPAIVLGFFIIPVGLVLTVLTVRGM
jgi:hypothetical protein